MSVELRDAAVEYRSALGIRNLTFAAAHGEAVALFGGAGAGKSTALRLMAGRVAPSAGTVRVLGRAPTGRSRSVGYAAEGARLSPIFTPHQVLSHRLALSGGASGPRAANMAEALTALDLYGVRDRPVRELSHGQRLRVVIAAALVQRPSVLLLDNLTAFLPEADAARLDGYLDARRRSDGLTVVRATTSSREAERCDRVVMLKGGAAASVAAPDELLNGCAADMLYVEAADPAAVQSTLRGIFDIEITETGDGVRFRAADGTSAAAAILRNPAGGARAVYLRRPTLWDVLEGLPPAAS